MSLSWLSNLRWIAGAAVLVATLGARWLLDLGIDLAPLFITGLAILVYNLAFRQWLNRIQCDLSGSSPQARTLARVQIAADWVAMITLLHFSGGIESPLVLFFLFHTTLAAILLPARDTYLFAGFASLLVTGNAVLEYVGVLPHVHIAGLLPSTIYRNPTYVGTTLGFFVATVMVTAYLATRTTSRLRTREAEIFSLGVDLQQAYGRLESLYDSAQVVGSTLELQEVLDRLTRSTTEVMAMKACTIRLLHGTGTELCLASSYGLSDEYLQKGCVLLDQNPLEQKVLSGEVVAVGDLSKENRVQYPAEAAAEGIRATLTAPLLGKEQPLGVLRVYCGRVRCFTDEDRQFLATVARYGSIAIENAMAYQTVQSLEEAKRKFVLMVTHELRSPVGVIRSLLNTLSGGYAGSLSDVQADMVGRALRRTDLLQTLIDDMLNLAAAKTGLRGDEQTEPVDLRQVLQTVAERYGVPAQEKDIDLQVTMPDGVDLQVAARREDIDRAFTNLVSNAVKYTPNDGRVSITTTVQGTAARVEVADSGIGIPEDALPHLFEEFYRAPNAKERVKHGTGLGLVITKDIITRYGGTIRVSSEEGHGTTFTVILPLTMGEAGAAPGEAKPEGGETGAGDAGTPALIVS